MEENTTVYKTTLGNFMIQPTLDFPHDCELYQSIQDNMFLTMMLGNIAGDKIILYGCELVNMNTRRDPGYLFLRTQDHPQGEVLYFSGGNVSSGLHLKVDTFSVTAQGKEFTQAYNVRTLAAGGGPEQYDWSEFRDVKTVYQLEEELEKLKTEVGSVYNPPFGLVEMWCGEANKVPAGYLLCDGEKYEQARYPKLYAAIGNKYNVSGTAAGYFCVPNLSEKFITGYNPKGATGSDYRNVGNTGGKEKVQLSEAEMPSHCHQYSTWERGTKDYGRFSNKNNRDLPDRQWHDTTWKGGNQAHENRPPYFVLAYVLRAE